MQGSADFEPRRFGDLIPYQNDRKACTAIAGKVESVSEYTDTCINIRTHSARYSAEE